MNAHNALLDLIRETPVKQILHETASFSVVSPCSHRLSCM